MIRALVVVAMAGSTWNTRAQNLVPNAGFEDYDDCPYTIGQYPPLADWMVTMNSPDYFNVCDTDNASGVPYSLIGYQPAFAGNGHIGLITYSTPLYNAREFLGTELLDPLQVGATYRISLRAVAALGGVLSMQYVSNGIGLAFRTSFYTQSPYVPLTILPALAHSEQLTDTATWVLVEGCFTADSAYTHVFVGNFLQYGTESYALVDPNGNSTYAYAYVDDVSVVHDPTCGIVGDDELAQLTVDASGVMRIRGSWTNGPIVADIWDAQGRSLARWSTDVGKLQGSQLPIDHLPQGFYVLQLSGPERRISCRFRK